MEVLEKPVDPYQYWEVLAKEVGDYLYKTYYDQVSGWSIRLSVLPHTQVNDIFEPDLHGPIYKIGDI